MRLNRRRFLKHTMASMGMLLAQGSYDAPVMMDIPFVSQADSEDRICGECCWRGLSMWRMENYPEATYLPTIDDLTRLWNRGYDQDSWVKDHMWPHIGDMGFTGELTEYATARWFRDRISSLHPCVATIRYRLLPINDQAWEFTGEHHVLVTGVDRGGFYFNDSLWADSLNGAGNFISEWDWNSVYLSEAIAVTGFTRSIYE